MFIFQFLEETALCLSKLFNSILLVGTLQSPFAALQILCHFFMAYQTIHYRNHCSSTLQRGVNIVCSCIQKPGTRLTGGVLVCSSLVSKSDCV